MSTTKRNILELSQNNRARNNATELTNRLTDKINDKSHSKLSRFDFLQSSELGINNVKQAVKNEK